MNEEDEQPEKVKFECLLGFEYNEDLMEQHKSVVKCIDCYNGDGDKAEIPRLHDTPERVNCPVIGALKAFREDHLA